MSEITSDQYDLTETSIKTADMTSTKTPKISPPDETTSIVGCRCVTVDELLKAAFVELALVLIDETNVAVKITSAPTMTHGLRPIMDIVQHHIRTNLLPPDAAAAEAAHITEDNGAHEHDKRDWRE